MEYCKYCHTDRVVPVLDEAMEQQPGPGNQYRRYCLACTRWLPLCSAKAFRTHPNAHVLPIDADAPIPLADSDTADRYPVSELVETVTARQDSTPHPDEEHHTAPHQELRTEILIECVLELTLDELIDPETASTYLAQKVNA